MFFIYMKIAPRCGQTEGPGAILVTMGMSTRTTAAPSKTSKRPRGRPRLGVRRAIILADDHWQFAAEYGEGEATAGIRAALDEAKARLRKRSAKRKRAD